MRRSIAAVLVAVLALSAVIVALPGAFAAPTSGSSSSSVAHPAAGLSVNPLDQFGGYTTDYWAGYDEGQVYFRVTDLNGDATGTVQINDQNASRDGIINPAMSWTVTLTGGFNDSTLWGGHYLIPFNLPYGGQWNMTFRTTLGGFIDQNFTVHVYSVSTGAVQPGVLAAHPFTVTWMVQNKGNGSTAGLIRSRCFRLLLGGLSSGASSSAG